MNSRAYVTTGELATELGAPVWKVRRAVDALAGDLPRAGQYRLIPRRLAERVRAALKKTAAPSLSAEAASL
jgi:hypothetical protein